MRLMRPFAGPDFVIVGPLRAGTTLLRLIMGSHPAIADVGEFEESVALLDSEGWPAIQTFSDWLSLHRPAVSRNYSIPDDAGSYSEIVHAMWSQLAEKHDTPIHGCTIHSRIDRIHDLWPKTKLICIVRDPRDVCQSSVGMGWFGHPAAATSNWLEPIRRIERALKRIPEHQGLLIRYEDLLSDPEGVLDRCCRLLGIRFHEDMLLFHKFSSYDSLDPSLAEQWRKKMEPRTAEIIEAACSPGLQKYGYEASRSNPKPMTVVEHLNISFLNRIGRLRFRVRRYGLSLVCQWAIVKRLAFSNSLRRQTQFRLNEIDMKHLK